MRFLYNRFWLQAYEREKDFVIEVCYNPIEMRFFHEDDEGFAGGPEGGAHAMAQ